MDECAATHVVAAFDPRLDCKCKIDAINSSLTQNSAYNGVYLENGNLSDDLQPTATNPADVEKLWKLSEELVGQEFSS